MTRKGWCPGALRPMPAGDGLLLRVRPHGSRLQPAQVAGLARISAAFGNGQLDLGSRATLQVRGVREDSLPEVQCQLRALELLDADPWVEARRNIMTTPFWHEGDGTPELVRRLEEALRNALDLPPKFGFAIDTGECPVLQGARADIRIERAGVICCCAPTEWPWGNGLVQERCSLASSNCWNGFRRPDRPEWRRQWPQALFPQSMRIRHPTRKRP